ncbi:ABC transporter substrate-binding protein [Yinghuangia aomiensis]
MRLGNGGRPARSRVLARRGGGTAAGGHRGLFRRRRGRLRRKGAGARRHADQGRPVQPRHRRDGAARRQSRDGRRACATSRPNWAASAATRSRWTAARSTARRRRRSPARTSSSRTASSPAFDGFNSQLERGHRHPPGRRDPVGRPDPVRPGHREHRRRTVSSSPHPRLRSSSAPCRAFKAEGKASATLTLVDTPAAHKTVDTELKPLSQLLGIQATGLYFSATNPNFSAVASTIASTKPDVAGLIASPSESVCTQLVKNLRSVGYTGDIFAAACTSFIKADPAAAVGAALYSSVWLPGSEQYAPPGVADQLRTAGKYLNEAGGPADYYGYGQFATVVDFAKGLSAAPSLDNLTGATVLSTLQAMKGTPSFLGPDITCGKATTPNCTTQMLLFTVQKDLTLKPVTGTWITPAPAIMATIPGAS